MKNDANAPSDTLSQKQGDGVRSTLLAVLAAFIITVLYFAVIYSCFDFIYEINDDVAMRNVAAGVITGTPDAHLIFIKYILGLVISGLYAVIPGFDWYGIFMVGVMLFCLCVFLYRGLSEDKSAGWKILYCAAVILIYTIIGLEHLVAFQWTVVAAFAGATGVFFFATAGDGGLVKTKAEEAVAVVLLVVCMLIRTKVFYMCLPAAGIVFWAKYGSVKKGGRFCPALRHIAVPAALAACFVVMYGVENQAYSSEEWHTFLAYNEDRSAIMDYYGISDYEEDQEFYESLGLSSEEVENLQRYSLYLSSENFYPDIMRGLADHAGEQEKGSGTLARLKSGIKLVLEHLKDMSYAPLNILAYVSVVLVLVVGFLKDRRVFATGFFVNVAIGFLWVYLGYQGRIVDRVGFSMLLFQLLSMLGLSWQLTAGAGEKITDSAETGKVAPSSGETVKLGLKITCGHLAGFVGTAAVFAVLVVLTSYKWVGVSEDMGWRKPYNEQYLALNEYMAEHMDNVYFMTTFSIEVYTDNFTILRDSEFSNLLSLGGWHTFSPLEDEKCAKLGIDDAVSDIVDKDNVYVVTLENVTLGYMDRYFTSLYGDDYLGRELVDTITYGDAVFEVYKFSTAL